jgi:hypothetical protein
MSNTVNKLLSAGATLDWISPLVAIIQDLVNGPHHDFYVDWNAGWSVNEIKRLLKRNGVRVWGAMLIDSMIVFTVRQAQAARTQDVLQQRGVPIVAGFLPEASLHPHSRPIQSTGESFI